MTEYKYTQIIVQLTGGQDIVLPHDVITLHQLTEIMGTDQKAYFVDENLNKFNLIGRHIQVVIEVAEDVEDEPFVPGRPKTDLVEGVVLG